MSAHPSLSDGVLKAMVILARNSTPGRVDFDPQPGDLVVEITKRPIDPDAIGWLVGHDDAPYHEDDPLDGSVPMREVWDVRPLSGRHQPGRDYQRWENAQFVGLPADVTDLIRKAIR
jgi:hypothetical protein